MSFLYDQCGKRKYLTVKERKAFLNAAREMRPEVYIFCATLAYTGARISEILVLVPGQIDFADQTIIIECLKKRRRGVHRAIPLPSSLLQVLRHLIQEREQTDRVNHDRLWPWSRTTAWKYVKCAMAAAGLSGPNACPKGLRHSFGVCAIQHHTPITMVQKWLGHSSISTTAIYADAVGSEERDLAERFWRTFD